MERLPSQLIRSGLRAFLPETDIAGPAGIKVEQTYLPFSHAKALGIDNVIVEGIRGSGKSFWWNALANSAARRHLTEAFPELRLHEGLIVEQGFGAGAQPTTDILAHLHEKFKARQIWRTVIATKLKFPLPFPATDKWTERVTWVSENPEEYDRLITKADEELATKNQVFLLLFDALDRLADSWPEIRILARGLFQTALELRSLRAIRFKLFVRPDMVADQEVFAFPDASKLLIRKVTLDWRRADLYALVFQSLGNARDGSGEAFRTFTSQMRREQWGESSQGVWILPRWYRIDELSQKALFHAITGPAMGAGATGVKRGIPYTWLPNHLLDGRQDVSPRSFVEALRKAAEETPDDWQYAVHFKGLQVGVQAASRIRVDELAEDYPWISSVMEPLRGKITIPCFADDFMRIWTNENVISKLAERYSGKLHHTDKLAPQSLDEGPEGLIKELKGLGILSFLSDGRIQIPDVYRIAFGLGRRGGVRPLR